MPNTQEPVRGGVTVAMATLTATDVEEASTIIAMCRRRMLSLTPSNSESIANARFCAGMLLRIEADLGAVAMKLKEIS